MSKLTAIQDLVRKGESRSALQALDEVSLADLTPEDTAFYNLLKGEVLVALGQYDHKHIEIAIDYYRHTSCNSEFAHAKFLQGWRLQSVGNVIDAKESFLEAYAGFLRVEKFNKAALALNRLALILFQNGEIENALENIDKSMRYYRESGEETRAQKLYINRATILFMTGSFERALESFNNAEQSLGKFSKREVGVFHLTRGMTLGLLGKVPEAQAQLNKGLAELTGFDRDIANHAEFQGWLLYLKGDYQDARSTLLEGLIKAQAIAPQSALISQIKRLLADTNLALKDYDRAKTYATEALEVAEKINERAEIAACWRVLARLAAHDRNNHEARTKFTKAINLYSMISSRYELAVTRYHAALTSAYPPAEATAMLSMAYEYFVSEDVTPFIDITGKALAELKKTSPLTIKRPPESALPTIITQNAGMRKLLDLAENIAPSEMSVLLTGETGTGKDLMARYIHAFSGRTGKFVPVNAAAIPRDMAESELFGHSKGAFTGAATARTGLFEAAEGGTFYLNEIGDTDSAFQAKLLEVLETKTIRRLGENQERQIGFRLIAATNHNLQKRVQEGSFRLDLYHRLNQIPIQLPSLSDRLDDIPLLLVHFLGKNGGGKEAMKQKRLLEKIAKRLQEIVWPGNIRQLEGDIQRWWHDSECNLKRMFEMLPEPTDLSRDRLVRLLEETSWNRRETARLLNISEGTVRYRMKKLGLEDPAAIV